MTSIPLYKIPTAPLASRVSDLLGRMTRDEKIGQLSQVAMQNFEGREQEYLADVRAGKWGSRILAESAWAGNNSESALDVEQLNRIQKVAIEESRLGIPLLYGRDVIYGHRTVCPIPHSQAASFNPDLIEEAMGAVASEASAEGVHWTFAPALDLVRDPRWGRVIESYGEDPFLISALGAAAIRGFQGNDPSKPDRLLACAKHVAGYGGSEGGRDYDTTEWSDNTLHNMVLAPFRAAASAGVATAMGGFNDLGGTPASAHRSILRSWLKEQLGWEGFVVSDWGSVFDLIGHGFAADEREAALKGFSAGIDHEMTAGIFERNLGPLLASGDISEQMFNDAVSRVLLAKFRAGLFENPYVDPERRNVVLRHPRHLSLAERLATESIVLLRNNGILPLTVSNGPIAVVGPYAEARREHLGSWCLDGRPTDVTSILSALKKGAPHVDFITAPPGFSDACLDVVRASQLAILCLGESHLRNGENKSIAELSLPPGQEELIQASSQFGVPIIVVDCSGRYLPSPAAQLHASAILHAGSLGTEAGTAISRVLLGRENPSGKLPMTIPRSTGQIPISYNRKAVGKAATFEARYRGYEDILKSPLYSFGFGLSYTTFRLEAAQLSAPSIRRDGEVAITATIKNTGARAGAEVVQLYIRDVVASTTRPSRELKAFRKVWLEPEESLTVHFAITARELSFYTANCRWELEPGEFRLGLGTDSSCELPLVLTALDSVSVACDGEAREAFHFSVLPNREQKSNEPHEDHRS